VWQEFVAKNPGWSPIRELATPAITTLSAFSHLSVRTVPHQATLNIL